eukprot:scaffold70631_cov55-Phaeocystis_antarctica.AAC.4
MTEVALERNRRRIDWGRVEARAAHAGGDPSHHAQPGCVSRGACEGCRRAKTYLHASGFKRRALQRSCKASDVT